jgi:hypothetical protein
MKKHLQYLLLSIVFACSSNSDELHHPFKIEGTVDDAPIKWNGTNTNFEYSNDLFSADDDSVSYGFTLIGGASFGIYTKKMLPDQLQNISKVGVYKIQDDYDLRVVLLGNIYKPKPSTGSFEITQRQIMGDKIRVRGKLDCTLIHEDTNVTYTERKFSATLVTEFSAN